jgi:uncharacterized protein
LSNQEHETLLQFPCDFPIKIIGNMDNEFIPLIKAIIHSHCPDFEEKDRWHINLSKGSKYCSITAHITAHNKKQLDDLYRELSQHPKVLMVL